MSFSVSRSHFNWAPIRHGGTGDSYNESAFNESEASPEWCFNIDRDGNS